MQQGLISVIIPVYKAEAYLKECVRTIQKQTYANLEIILVNDGSPDRSGDICDEIAGEDKRVKVIHKSNSGAASARNAGLDSAKGEFIAFVDSDDTIEENMYECLYDRITETTADICICGFKVLYENYTRVRKTPHERVMSSIQLFEAFLEDYKSYAFLITGPWNKLIRREILLDQGNEGCISVRFPECLRNAEDMWFIVDCICAAGNGVAFIDFTPYLYSLVNNPLSLSSEDSKEIFDDRSRALNHLSDVMLGALPERTTDIESFTKLRHCINLVHIIRHSAVNKKLQINKFTWSSLLTILHYSNNCRDKISALMLFFLPFGLYRKALYWDLKKNG